jgi:hypothetical protein
MSVKWISIIVFGLASFIVNPVVFGQGTGPVDITIDVTAPGRVIPDPNNIEGLVHFLRNKSIAKELNFDEQQRGEVEKLLRETGGSLTAFSTPGVPGQTLEEYKAVVALKKAKNRLAFEALLDPKQEARLVQIAYHVEIARIGMGESLINGFFGENVGVENYQKSALSTVSAAIEREAVNSIKTVALELRKRFCEEELTLQQREQLDELLGKWFLFVENPGRDSTLDFAIPNPDSKKALLSLLNNRSVATELGLTGERQELLRHAKKRLSQYSNEAGAIAIQLQINQEEKSKLDSEVESAVVNLFSEEEWQRLRQVAFQVEIAKIGIAKALLGGRLGKQIEIEKAQRDSIAKSEAGEIKLLETIGKVRQVANKKMLKELPALQRERAEKILGKDFQFVEERIKVDPFEHLPPDKRKIVEKIIADQIKNGLPVGN